MKFCQSHWDMLRAEIARVGLDGLVPKDGQEAMAKMVKSLEHSNDNPTGPGQVSTFDPLMGAHWAIVGNVMPYVGLALMAPKEDGTDRCPLCFITEDHHQRCTVPHCKVTNWDDWIVRAVDDQLQKAKALGLVHST